MPVKKWLLILLAVVIGLLWWWLSAGRRFGPARSQAPIPLKAFALFDVQGLWGGQDLWVGEDGRGYAQVVKPEKGEGGLQARRYSLRLSPKKVAELERLLGVHDFINLTTPRRPGVPDEARPVICVWPQSGTPVCVSKWAGDKHPDFDAVYEAALGLLSELQDDQVAYRGPFDWGWHPPGFSSRGAASRLAADRK
jgi:hypothetical protein